MQHKEKETGTVIFDRAFHLRHLFDSGTPRDAVAPNPKCKLVSV